MALLQDLLAQLQLQQQNGPLPGLPQYGPVTPGGTPPPGISYQPFGPQQNLIGTQITPGTSPDVASARSQLGTQLGALQGPDRGALAQQTFQQLTDATAPQYQQELRGVGEQAAALGRIGSGVTTSELGDVALQRQKYLGNLAAQLSTQAAGQTLNDRLAALQGTEGGLGTLAGLDQVQYQNLAGERGYEAGQSQQAFNNALAAAGLTQPNPLATQIGNQYGQQAQQDYGTTGGILQLLMQQYGPKPYQGTGSDFNVYNTV